MKIQLTTLLFLFLIFILSPFNSFSQLFLYDAGSSIEDEAMSISKDSNGNLYTTGYFGGHCVFSTTFSFNTAGASDIFLMKFSPPNNVEWVKTAGGYGEDRGLSVKTDDSGNSYITGFFSGIANFGAQTLTAFGGQDIFIAKYNSAGNLIWVVQAGGSGMDVANSLNIDNYGNIIITGQFVGTASFGTTTITSLIDPQTAQYALNTFVAKYDTSGNFIWVKQGASDKNNRGIAVTTDDAGNVYATGQFSDTLQFDVVHNNDNYNSIFLVKFDPSGNELWFKRIGGSINNLAYDITCDHNNNVLLTGEVHGALHFYDNSNYVLVNSYNYQAFVAKFNSGGDLLWAISDGSSSEVSSRAISINDANEILISGTFKCKFSEYADVFGQGTFNSVGYNDIFVTKYNENGQRQWMRNFGGKKEDYLHDMIISNNRPVMVGSFRNVLVIPVGGGLITNNHEVSYNYNFYEVNYGIEHCSDLNYGHFSELESFGSSDIFIVDAINLNRSPYDYYKRTDSSCDCPYVGCCIGKYNSSDMSCINSIENCESVHLYACSNTSAGYNYNFPLYSQGPNFTYLWSTGSTGRSVSITNSGIYSVTVTSEDGCFQSYNTAEAIVHPNPETPWISDNFGFGINSPAPYTFAVCADSATLTGSNITTDEFIWYPGGTPNDSTITVYSSSTYHFSVTDTNGCSSENYVNIVLTHGTLPPVEPYLLDITDSVSNDTIFVCQGLPIVIHILDFISDSAHMNPCNPVLNGNNNWSVASSLPMNSCGYYCHCETFMVDTSNYYHFTDTLIRVNICDTDTAVADITYYVEVMPSPEINLSISGNNQFCPGDSIWLIACCADSYQWTSSNSFMGDPYNDSILVWFPGTFYLHGTVLNSYGCSANASIGQNVQYWSSPQITMSPANGVICPNDSVMLSITTGSIINYEWYGPTGLVPVDSSVIYVNAPGYYYCIVTYSDSCYVSSNTVEVKQYITPFLEVMPNELICDGDSVLLFRQLNISYQEILAY